MAPLIILSVAAFGLWLAIDTLRLVAAENAQLAKGPCNMPQSQKHVRKCVGAGTFRISYYGHDGRKVTTREFPMSRYSTVLQSARAKGYRVI